MQNLNEVMPKYEVVLDGVTYKTTACKEAAYETYNQLVDKKAGSVSIKENGALLEFKSRD